MSTINSRVLAGLHLDGSPRQSYGYRIVSLEVRDAISRLIDFGLDSES